MESHFALLLILSFFVFPLCAHTHLVRNRILVQHRLSGTVSLAKLGHQAHIIFESSLKSHHFKLSYSPIYHPPLYLPHPPLYLSC